MGYFSSRLIIILHRQWAIVDPLTRKNCYRQSCSSSGPHLSLLLSLSLSLNHEPFVLSAGRRHDPDEQLSRLHRLGTRQWPGVQLCSREFGHAQGGQQAHERELNHGSIVWVWIDYYFIIIIFFFFFCITVISAFNLPANSDAPHCFPWPHALIFPLGLFYISLLSYSREEEVKKANAPSLWLSSRLISWRPATECLFDHSFETSL